MFSLRHLAAMFIVVVIPPCFFTWLLIHPIATVWRKIGGFTYIFVLFYLIGAILGISKLYNVHGDLLYFETNAITVWLSVPCFIFTAVMAFFYKKQFDIRMIIGLPEITKEDFPGKLITEGLYSKIRHPRYVGAFVFILGLAILVNAPVPYIVIVLLIPLIYVIVFFEEKELKKRFGLEYEKYCLKVPRFFPKIF